MSFAGSAPETVDELRRRYAEIPAYSTEKELDQSKVDRSRMARVGDKLFEFRGGDDGTWNVVREFPKGTFSATTAQPAGALGIPGITTATASPSPTATASPSPTASNQYYSGGYQPYGIYAVPPAYSGPYTAKGPGWDYQYPYIPRTMDIMPLGAGGQPFSMTPLSPLFPVSSVASTGAGGQPPPGGQPGETESGGEGGGPAQNFWGWGPGQTAPSFSTSPFGAMGYGARVAELGPSALGAGFKGAGDPTWGPESTYARGGLVETLTGGAPLSTAGLISDPASRVSAMDAWRGTSANEIVTNPAERANVAAVADWAGSGGNLLGEVLGARSVEPGVTQTHVPSEMHHAPGTDPSELFSQGYTPDEIADIVAGISPPAFGRRSVEPGVVPTSIPFSAAPSFGEGSDLSDADIAADIAAADEGHGLVA